MKEFTEEENPSRTFFGTGYLTASTSSAQDPLSEFSFKFSSSSSNGILLIAFHASDPSLFQAVELSDGFLALSYNLGCGNEKVLSTRVYDTGKEVSISKTQTVGREKLTFNLEVKTLNMIETLESTTERCFKRGRDSRFPAKFVYWGGIDNRTLIPKNV